MTEKSAPPEERDAVSSGSAKETNGSEGGDLAFCLLKISQIHGLFVSLERLLSGLPLKNDILVPSCFERAAAKAGMTSRITHAPLGKLNTALLPLVLVLSENRACVLLSMNRQNGVARVLFPELGDGETTIELSRLETLYSGYAFYVKPLFRFDERAPSYNRKRSSSWFWSSISENRPIYRDVITTSAISNVFALAMPLFTMNIYNRIIPNRAMDSLWVTAAGVLIMVSADFLLHMARTHLVDKAAARTNTRLSAIMMEQVLALKTADRPSSVGSFANVIQGFESVRNFISSATLFAYVDIPFSLFFLLIISLIAWPLAIPLAVGSVLILLHAALIQGTMRDLAETTNRASALKNATLIESLVGMETVKSQGAESHVQKRWETSVSFLEHVNTRLRLLSGSVITGTPMGPTDRLRRDDARRRVSGGQQLVEHGCSHRRVHALLPLHRARRKGRGASHAVQHGVPLPRRTGRHHEKGAGAAERGDVPQPPPPEGRCGVQRCDVHLSGTGETRAFRGLIPNRARGAGGPRGAHRIGKEHRGKTSPRALSTAERHRLHRRSGHPSDRSRRAPQKRRFRRT